MTVTATPVQMNICNDKGVCNRVRNVTLNITGVRIDVFDEEVSNLLGQIAIAADDLAGDEDGE